MEVEVSERVWSLELGILWGSLVKFSEVGGGKGWSGKKKHNLFKRVGRYRDFVWDFVGRCCFFVFSSEMLGFGCKRFRKKNVKF